MITYKYKLYKTPNMKYLDQMLCQCAFVWNHCLALQKRYYNLYHNYEGGKCIQEDKLKKHFTKYYGSKLYKTLNSQSVQEIIERLNYSFERYFKHTSSRPPKFKKACNFKSFVFKQHGYILYGNELIITSIKKKFKFSLSRQYPERKKIKNLRILKNKLGEYFIFMNLDIQPQSYSKTHDGASIGIDFGLINYMTLSDGRVIDNPTFLKHNLKELHNKSKKLSKSQERSKNKERKRLELVRLYNDIVNKRDNWQWEIAHQLCRQYDYIFIENLNLVKIERNNHGKKIQDYAHGEFIKKLKYIATKYGVIVHTIENYYPSTRLCQCGYKNNNLKLWDREWICPKCGRHHHRDITAAKNILRKGICELRSNCKTNLDFV